MAKPAAKALDRILAKHPTARLDLRRERSLQADLGDGRKALVTSIGAMHYRETEVGGDDWLPIDTTWQPTTGAWQYEMANGPYRASSRLALNSGEVLEYAARSGEWVRFQPLSLNWRDENGSTQQVAIPQAVDALVTGAENDVLSWAAGYGPGRDFSWTAHPTRLQKLLTINAASDLPTPTVTGGGVELELTFAFTFDASVTAFVDGVAWDRSTTRTTGAAIEFRSSAGETLWHFTAPRAWDSEGTETTGVMSFYRVGNTRHVAVRIPRAFVDAAVFPLFVDPTVTVDVAAGADDYDVTVTGSTYFSAITPSFFFGKSSFGNEAGGAIFRDVGIPAASTITEAVLTVTAAGGGSAATSVLVRCEDADNPTRPTNLTSFNALTYVSPDTAWATVPAFTVGTAYSTPDFKGTLQEVIDRAGWASGNGVHVVLYENGSTGTGGRTAATYENGTYAEPSLYVEYTGGITATITSAGHDYEYGPSGASSSQSQSVSGTPGNFGGRLYLHFHSLAIPQGQTLGSARLILTGAGSDTAGDVNADVTAEAVDNATVLTSTAPYNATRTSASVPWDTTANLASGERAPIVITGIIQELVNRTGWVSGNNINLMVEGDSTGTGVRKVRALHTAGDPTPYATLEVMWDDVAGGTAVTLSPDGTVSSSGIEDQAAGTTDLHLAIDDSPDASDGDTTYLVNSGSASGHVWVTLSDTPSDFGSMTTISVRVRARRE